VLLIADLDVFYGEVQVLHGVSMDVPSQSIVCTMGRNGVGKTTLMQTIMGLNRARHGRLALEGCDMTEWPTHRRVRAGLAYVPQGRHIFNRLTVQENLQTGLSAAGKGVRGVPAEVYEFFPILRDLRTRRGGNLSGGQQQQLAIGRALVTQPRLLILDEPTEGIQPNTIQLIGGILRRLVSEKGMTILIVEQYLDFVRAFSDRFYIMNRGRVVEGGLTSHLNDDLVKQYLHV
jgi:urea transport system ATP-binding protein